MNHISQPESLKAINESPFHHGEQAIQSRLGVREQMEKFGSKVIRDYMPEQHRNFYSQLPFLILGHCDKDGWPWASIVSAPLGFISSPDDKHLRIAANPINGDPLAKSLSRDLAIGVLGIEPNTRRRNRLSALVESASPNQIQLKVKQAFGNCPQYIQSRQSETIAPELLKEKTTISFTQLTDEAISLISKSDTFYVASSAGVNRDSDKYKASYGTDVSHRGGKPGFIDVDKAGVLTIPDYLGNNHFNTLGNFQVYPKAGLLFIDDKNQDVLMLTGSAEILWDDDMQPHFEGAQRFWRFKLDHGVWLKKSLPLKMTFESYSPNTLLTDDWQNARAMQQADTLKTQWQACRLISKVNESYAISSFYFKPESNVIAPFKAGQFLTLQVLIDNKPVIRTYTVSNMPGSNEYRITVKRDPLGVASNHLHNNLEIGQRVQIKAPHGKFTFDTTTPRPAVMLTAGIGITPIIAMLHEALKDNIKRRYIRSIIVIATVRSAKERAFANELNDIAKKSGGSVHIIWAMTSPEEGLTVGEDYHYKGRINPLLLQNLLPLDDYDFYLCGPDGFMQSSYDALQQLGVRDRRIMAESFGPSSLQRDSEAIETLSAPKNLATQALVTIKNKHGEILTEQQWTKKDGSLLAFAEAHGINPEFGCRSGHCGSCTAKLNSGTVSYDQEISAPISEDTLLLCCAKPALTKDDVIPSIDIQLPS